MKWNFGLLLLLIVSCKRDQTPTLSERLQGIWQANNIKEGSSVVFVKGSTNNSKPGYSQFLLDLSSPASVRLTEFDASVFAGTWEVSADQKTLMLKNLTPQPSATNGVIEYTIDSYTEKNLTISRKTASLKTGGILNVYNLTH